jgi:hypothetical protein
LAVPRPGAIVPVGLPVLAGKAIRSRSGRLNPMRKQRLFGADRGGAGAAHAGRRW